MADVLTVHKDQSNFTINLDVVIIPGTFITL